MREPAVAAVLGRAKAGTPGPEILHEIATLHGLKCLPKRTRHGAFDLLPRHLLGRLDDSPGLGVKQAVFLLCVERGHARIPDVIQQITSRRAHAHVVVYADEAHDSGVLAMKCANAPKGGGASGYLVRDRSSEVLIRELFRHLLTGRDPYPPFRLLQQARRREKRRAFVVTPYHARALTDYYEGIQPALDALKIEPIIARNEVTFLSIIHNVQTLMDDSEFVIVNLTEYEGYGPSANCYLELGYALGQKLPVILIHRAGSAPVATNLAGVQLVEYSHLSELSMRLYAGLK